MFEVSNSDLSDVSRSLRDRQSVKGAKTRRSVSIVFFGRRGKLKFITEVSSSQSPCPDYVTGFKFLQVSK